MTKEQPLMHCTIKKSMSVTKKIIIFGAKLSIVLAGIWIIWHGVTSPTFISKVSAALTWVINNINILSTILIAILTAIPWYIYVTIGIPITIVLYSYFWCVARTLNKSDWESSEANDGSGSIAIVSGMVAAVTLFYAAFCSSLIAIIFTLIVFLICTLAIIFSVTPLDGVGITKWYYIFRFPGAWLHHRRNNKIEIYHDID